MTSCSLEKDTPNSRGGEAVGRLPVSVYPGDESVGNHMLEVEAKANPLCERTSFLCPHAGPQSKHQRHKRQTCLYGNVYQLLEKLQKSFHGKVSSISKKL